MLGPQDRAPRPPGALEDEGVPARDAGGRVDLDRGEEVLPVRFVEPPDGEPLDDASGVARPDRRGGLSWGTKGLRPGGTRPYGPSGGGTELAERTFFAGSMVTLRKTTEPAPERTSAASTPEKRQSLKRMASMVAPGKPRT